MNFLITKKYLLCLQPMTIMNLSDAIILQRTQVVSTILGDKKLTALFPRDLQYLGIAIIDRFFAILSANETLPSQKTSLYYFSVSALVIAHKFGKNESIELKKILGLLKKEEEGYEGKKMIMAEEEILTTINFEIPETTCYLELQKFINCRGSCEKVKNDLQVKTAMKLLKEMILMSWEVSEYPEVGKEVLELVERKRSSERSKRLYKMVISSMKQKKQVKVETVN